MTAKRVLRLLQRRGKEMSAGLTDTEREAFKTRYQTILAPLQPNDSIDSATVSQIRELMFCFKTTEQIWCDEVMATGADRFPTALADLPKEIEELVTVQEFKPILSFFKEELSSQNGDEERDASCSDAEQF